MMIIKTDILYDVYTIINTCWSGQHSESISIETTSRLRGPFKIQEVCEVDECTDLCNMKRALPDSGEAAPAAKAAKTGPVSSAASPGSSSSSAAASSAKKSLGGRQPEFELPVASILRLIKRVRACFCSASHATDMIPPHTPTPTVPPLRWCLRPDMLAVLINKRAIHHVPCDATSHTIFHLWKGLWHRK